ncbi:hypothetical protein FHG87_021767, partial [Trinorchestia longiramus]
MRVLIFVSFLVGLAVARPETISEQRRLPDEVNSVSKRGTNKGRREDAVRNVLKIIPALTENIRSSDRSQAVQNIGSAVAEIVKES